MCTFHSGKLDLAEAGRKGGRARGNKQEQSSGDRLEGLAHAALEELLGSSGNATARAAAARLVLDKIAASSAYSAELAKRALWAEQQARLAAEMPALREKLNLMIERRARSLAEQMTEAELADLVERRATEKAKELHDEQKRLELEAVKVELAVPEERAGGA